jgi:mRNA interferase RelE/StbE
MSLYEITFARSARKELQALPTTVAERILAKIGALETNPRPQGCKKLRGPTRLWRLRVGDYRIVYDVDDDKRVIDISVIRHRGEAYR